MTVRELCGLLEDLENQDAEVVIFGDEEGNYVITEVECEVCDYWDEEFDKFDDGTVILRPLEFQ